MIRSYALGCAIGAIIVGLAGYPGVGLIVGLGAFAFGVIVWAIDGLMTGDQVRDARRRNRP